MQLIMLPFRNNYSQYPTINWAIYPNTRSLWEFPARPVFLKLIWGYSHECIHKQGGGGTRQSLALYSQTALKLQWFPTSHKRFRYNMTQNKILSIHKSLGRYSLCIVLRLYKFCKENICFEVGVFFPKRMLSQLRRRQPDNCFKKSICICYQHCDKKMFVSWLTAVIHWRIF